MEDNYSDQSTQECLYKFDEFVQKELEIESFINKLPSKLEDISIELDGD